MIYYLFTRLVYDLLLFICLSQEEINYRLKTKENHSKKTTRNFNLTGLP